MRSRESKFSLLEGDDRDLWPTRDDHADANGPVGQGSQLNSVAKDPGFVCTDSIGRAMVQTR